MRVKKIEDFITDIKPLSHQGTRIWIINLKQDIREELLENKAFMNYIEFSNYIAATWWEIIRNWSATFIVNFDGTDHKVALPELPTVEKEKTFTNERISDLGKVKKLVLRYCRDEVPKQYRGISVQRGGMTILRLSVSAEETIKNRIYGYCTFDENLELELKKVELPNHFGFRDKRAWNHSKEYIRRKLEEFVQEISPIKKKEANLPQDLVERAVLIVNNLVRKYAPELSADLIGSGKGKKSSENSYVKRLIPAIRIDTFWGNSRKLEYDESLLIECELVNDTAEKAKLELQVEIVHENGDLKLQVKYNTELEGNSKKRIDIPLVDFQEVSDKPGEYKAMAVLQGEQMEGAHRRGFTFYLHEEPPLPKGRVFLSTMRFLYGKGKPFEKKKQLPLTEKGTLYIVYDHPDFMHVREIDILMSQVSILTPPKLWIKLISGR
jgi:hypothetical protein